MDRLSVIKSPIEAELEKFKNLYHDSLSSSNPLLEEVFSHLRQRQGKMMRPILVLLTARLLGTVSAATFHAALALELLHAASLVHDDIVDESGQRRGQLSVNAAFSNKVAVLSGDFMLATCLVHAGKTRNNSIVDAIAALGCDLSEGELLQLYNVNNPKFSEEVYFDVIRKKTAALFSACTSVAALSVDATREQCENAYMLGEYIGICFQIRDDIFDYYDSDAIGKPTGNDMLEGKLTLPALYVLNLSGADWAKEIAAKIKTSEATVDEITRLIVFVKEKGGIEYAQKVMYSYRDKALSILNAMPDSSVKTSLIFYLAYVVERDR